MQIAKQTELVEEYMRQVRGLSIGRQESYRLVDTKDWQRFMQRKADLLYEQTQRQFGHLIHDPPTRDRPDHPEQYDDLHADL